MYKHFIQHIKLISYTFTGQTFHEKPQSSSCCGMAPTCLQKLIVFSFGNYWSFCSCFPDVSHIVRPHPDYLICSLQAWMSLLAPTVSKQKFDYIVFPIYLTLKTNSLQLKTPFRTEIPFASPQHDSAHFWR